MRWREWLIPLLAATILTGLNAPKPPVVDDHAYLCLARQIAKEPCDPYGFTQFWFQYPERAVFVLAPPALPYWLGLGIRVVGDHPVRLKLWLFPIALLLTASLHLLLRRFARGLEQWGVLAVVFSPWCLPAFNFMLDVPVLAVGLASIVVHLRAIDRRSWTLALFSGFLAGVALQTKYTAAVYPAIMLAAGLIHRRFALSLTAAVVASLLFIGWESFIAFKYEQSHFLIQLLTDDPSRTPRIQLARPLIYTLGAVAVAAILFGMIGFGARRRWILATIAGIILCYLVPPMFSRPESSAWIDSSRPGTSIGGLLFVCFGYPLVFLSTAVCLRLLTRWKLNERCWRWRWHRSMMRYSREAWLLVGWLIIELAGYFATSPFVATRRTIGVAFVLTLLTARFASRGLRLSHDWWSVRIVGGFICLLGLTYASVDIVDSFDQPNAMHEAHRWIRERDADHAIWYCGHWSIQNVGEQLGMTQVEPGVSALAAGDWMIVPSKFVPKAEIKPEPKYQGDPVHTVIIRRAFPYRTNPAMYGGYIPMELWRRPRIELTIYRIQKPWTPSPKPEEPK